jgi:hemolysin activation/secretion protein
VIDPTEPSGEPPAFIPNEDPPPAKPSRPVLPSLEQLREEIVGVPPIQVFVKELKVVGYTVFSDQEIHAITDPYQHRLLTTEDIEAVRRELTLLYVDKGYINSGARIPDQGVEEGVVTLEIIEGTLDEIDVVVEGAKHFHPFYFRSRIRLGVEEPLNVRPLQERLQLLLLDSRVERLNSELKPGSTLGSSVLDVRVKEASPYRAWAEFNNFQSPTVGAERGLGTVAHQNLLGLGDEFQFTYGQSEGLDPLIDGSYTLPITPYDTTVAFQYRHNNFEDVTDAFDDLDIKSKTHIFTFTLRQPVYRTLQDEVALSLTGEYLQNKTFLLGSGFAFTPGYTENGHAKITALRFTQEWTRRQSNQVLALRSRFSMGLDIFDATNNRVNEDDPDSHFFVWLGQAQWVRRIDPWGIQLLTSSALQLANDSLFPLQQFAVGGRFSVRGYRENTLVRDNAVLFSVETRLPVLPSFFGENVVYFAPFVDVGHAWNVHLDTIRPQDTLASVGTGVRINLFDRAQANVYWGMQLNHVPDPRDNNSLQDNGVHVQFVWNLF